MCGCGDSQEVGLEAAILERVRNSSLVEWSCADNSAGLKRAAEAADPPPRCWWFCCWLVGVWVVGERPAWGEARG